MIGGCSYELDGLHWFHGPMKARLSTPFWRFSPRQFLLPQQQHGFDESPHAATAATGEVTISKGEAVPSSVTAVTLTPAAITRAPTSPASVTPLTPVVASSSKAAEAAPDPTALTETVAVAVISDPPVADLFIDSKGFGSTPKQFQLKPGSHSIQVVKQGYKDWSTKLLVEPGAPTTVKAKLERTEQGKSAAAADAKVAPGR